MSTRGGDLATVTALNTRHSWLKQPRADDPNRHIRTCRRDACGLMKRSELVDGEWLEFWRWPDGEEGSGRKAPSCRAGQGAEVSPEPGSVPAALPPVPVAEPMSVPSQPVAGKPCCRCRPPLPACGLPTRLYPGGWMCDKQAAAAARARRGVA
jgi:hypothetical protein